MSAPTKGERARWRRLLEAAERERVVPNAERDDGWGLDIFAAARDIGSAEALRLLDALDAAEARAGKAEALLRTGNAELVAAGVEARADEEVGRLRWVNEQLLLNMGRQHGVLRQRSSALRRIALGCLDCRAEAEAALSPQEPSTAPIPAADTPDTDKNPEAGAEGAWAPDWSMT